jgi:hypothetical protein
MDSWFGREKLPVYFLVFRFHRTRIAFHPTQGKHGAALCVWNLNGVVGHGILNPVLCQFRQLAALERRRRRYSGCAKLGMDHAEAFGSPLWRLRIFVAR